MLKLHCNESADAVQSKFSSIYGEPGENDMLLAILPDQNNNNWQHPIRPTLKAWASKAGIALQNVKVSKFSNPKGGYFENLLNKMNLKAGGVNYFPTHEDRGGLQPGLGLLCQAPTLLLGIDVHHAAPRSQKPSYAAVVGTMDRDYQEHWTEVRQQREARQECIDVDDMVPMVRAQLQRFYEFNVRPPDRIIVFRDGVAHNQFEMVHRKEIYAIERACVEVGGPDYKPAIVFILEQKRNGARFFSTGPNGKVLDEQMGNGVPGTVIDTIIVDDHTFDYYFISHHGLKGTSRPTHYHVLRDDVSFASSDDLQRFTWELCHMFSRCQKLVSQVAPTYMAHLAAEMWGLKEEKPDLNSDTASVSSDGACDLHDRLKRRPFYV